MKNFIKLIVEKNSDKKRIDAFIFEKCSELSRTRIKNLILDKRLKINGKINELPSKTLINCTPSINDYLPKKKRIKLIFFVRYDNIPEMLRDFNTKVETQSKLLKITKKHDYSLTYVEQLLFSKGLTVSFLTGISNTPIFNKNSAIIFHSSK